jgi:hypothetical protein
VSPEHTYALTLAEAIHRKHFPEVTQWKPLPDLLGLLTQIDNMTSGLVMPAARWPFPSGGEGCGGLTQCDMHEDESC